MKYVSLPGKFVINQIDPIHKRAIKYLLISLFIFLFSILYGLKMDALQLNKLFGNFNLIQDNKNVPAFSNHYSEQDIYILSQGVKQEPIAVNFAVLNKVKHKKY